MVWSLFNQDREKNAPACRQVFCVQNLGFFSQFIAKCRLDNTTGIRYLNPSRLLPQYDCRLISIPTTYRDGFFYGTQPQIFPYSAREKGFLIKYPALEKGFLIKQPK